MDQVFTKEDPPWGTPGTGYWLAFRGFREARIALPDDLTADEAERVIATVREHLARSERRTA